MMQTGRKWRREKYCQLVSIKFCGSRQRAQWIQHLQSEPILTKINKLIRTDPVSDINRERGDHVLSWIVNKLMSESPGSHPDQ